MLVCVEQQPGLSPRQVSPLSDSLALASASPWLAPQPSAQPLCERIVWLPWSSLQVLMCTRTVTEQSLPPPPPPPPPPTVGGTLGPQLGWQLPAEVQKRFPMQAPF